MGLDLGGFGSIAGATIGGFIGGPTGAATGASIGAGIDKNSAAVDNANAAQNFSAQQYATRYQTQVKDLEAAGLNPMLAYMQSPGSAPSGVQAPVESITSGMASAGQAAKWSHDTENVDADTVLKRANSFLSEAQTHLAGASADQSRAMVHKLEAEATKIGAEIKNIPLEGDRLIAAAKSLESASRLTNLQAGTEVQRANQMKWLAVKTMVEGDLLTFDTQAIEKANNFGKNYAQFKPFIDTLINLGRAMRR